ncbi:NAD(P)-binding domain-containing protein, partial [Pseudomonas sp. GP01-A4]|uniref:NAD(P)-binding domain-containing protein n=1 Tax=Pseudomonas sp. GP01-A4 TaxID=2070571 RepID=UPI000CC84C92
MSQKAPVAIVGGGPWGRALAVACQRAGSETWCFSRQPSLPDGVRRLESIEEAGKRARLIVVAVPSAAATDVA